MEQFIHGILKFDWLVPALCDLVALAAVAGSVRLSRPKATPPPVKQVLAAAFDSMPSPRRVRLHEVGLAEVPQAAPEALPTARADVKKALAAIGRWEHHYGSSRGITELARWVEGQKQSREAVSAE
jgi:hypothetical protein